MAREKSGESIFAYNGGFYENIAQVFDWIMLSILWVIFSLPMITFGAASTAFYYTTVKVVKNERGNLLENFLYSFRINFKDATILWCIIVFFAIIFQLNVGILSALTDSYLGLFLICCYTFFSVFLLGIAVYAFPALSRFKMKAGWIFKLSIYMTVRYFPVTVILIGIIAGGILLIYLFPILILVVPTGIVVLVSYFMEKVLLKHTP